MTILVTVLSVITLLFWGLSDFLAGKGGKDLSPTLANFVVQAAGYPIILLIVLIKGFPEFSLSNLIAFFVISGLFTLAYVSMIKGMSIGPAGIVSPLANSYSAITLVFAVIFLGFDLSSRQLGAFIAIFLGVILLTFEKSRRKKPIKESAVVAGLLAAFFWGIGFGLLESQVADLPWYHLMFYISSYMLAMAYLILVVSHKSDTNSVVKKIVTHKKTVAAGLLVTIGSVSFFTAIEQLGSLVIPAVIASASPLATSFFANMIDKEKLLLYQRVGAISVVAGIVFLNT